jgi:hypothetical protein
MHGTVLLFISDSIGKPYDLIMPCYVEIRGFFLLKTFQIDYTWY